MKIKVTFNKNNADDLVGKYILYRSDERGGVYAEENIIKTFSKDEFKDSNKIEYIDPDTEYDTTYFYGLLTESSEGFSTVSAVLEIVVPKYMGDMSREIIVGDYSYGITGFGTASDDLELQVRRIFAKTTTADGRGGYHSSDGKIYTIDLFENGKPKKYILNNSISIYINNNTGSAAAMLEMARNFMEDMDKNHFFIDGFEYRFRLMTEKEFVRSVIHMITPASFNYFRQPAFKTQMIIPWIKDGVSEFGDITIALTDDSGVVGTYTRRTSPTGEFIVGRLSDTANAGNFCATPFVMEPVAY